MVTSPHIVILLLLFSVGRERMSDNPPKFGYLSLLHDDTKEAVDRK